MGASRLAAGAPGREEELSSAVELARRSGDLHTRTSAARDLAYGLLVTGRIERGLNLVRALADEARQLRLVGPERLFRVFLAGLHLNAGLPRVAADDLEEVLAEALEPTIGTPARFWLCEALVELGRSTKLGRSSRRCSIQPPATTTGWRLDEGWEDARAGEVRVGEIVSAADAAAALLAVVAGAGLVPTCVPSVSSSIASATTCAGSATSTTARRPHLGCRTSRQSNGDSLTSWPKG